MTKISELLDGNEFAFKGKKPKILSILGYDVLSYFSELIILGKTAPEIVRELNSKYCEGRPVFKDTDVYRLKRNKSFQAYFRARKKVLIEKLAYVDWKVEKEMKRFYEELTKNIDLGNIDDVVKARLKMQLIQLMIEFKRDVEIKKEENALTAFLSSVKKEIQSTPTSVKVDMGVKN